MLSREYFSDACRSFGASSEQQLAKLMITVNHKSMSDVQAHITMNTGRWIHASAFN